MENDAMPSLDELTSSINQAMALHQMVGFDYFGVVGTAMIFGSEFTIRNAACSHENAQVLVPALNKFHGVLSSWKKAADDSNNDYWGQGLKDLREAYIKIGVDSTKWSNKQRSQVTGMLGVAISSYGAIHPNKIRDSVEPVHSTIDYSRIDFIETGINATTVSEHTQKSFYNLSKELLPSDMDFTVGPSFSDMMSARLFEQLMPSQ